MFVFIVTFIIFPGTTNDTYLVFLNGINNEQSWFFLIMVFIFNLCDTTGRFMGGNPKL
jgi:hypothetical protein